MSIFNEPRGTAEAARRSGAMTSDGSVSGTRTDVDKALLGGATYRGLAEQRLSPAEERFAPPACGSRRW
jgi:hypothetical protein